MNFPSKSIFGLIFLGIAIQLTAFYAIDPLGFSDTIRYFEFADFLGKPQVTHGGDLGFNGGILFTPLFLPSFLFFLKKLFGFPYLLSGSILEFASFQAIIWLSYSAARRADGTATARLALFLLLTHLAFCFGSVLIMTEYPFMAMLLCVILYVTKTKEFNSKKTLILSFLLAILVSIRVQGLLFSIIIISYLLYRRRMRLRQVFIAGLFIFMYIFLYLCLYFYLDWKFPQTITLNEAFSANCFILRDAFAQYDFSTHGLRALTGGKNYFDFIASNPFTYIYTAAKSFIEAMACLNTELRHYYYPFCAILLLSFFFSKIKEKSLIISLIVFNFFATIIFPVPRESFIRYQTGTFPLAMILIASLFTHGHENKFLRGDAKRFALSILFCSMLFYEAYFIMRNHHFFRAMGAWKYTQPVTPRSAAVDSARLIRDNIGSGGKVLAQDMRYYGIIYHSGNTPLYFYEGWEKRAIMDYVETRGARYAVGNDALMYGLRFRGIGVSMVCPLIKTLDENEQLFLFKLRPK